MTARVTHALLGPAIAATALIVAAPRPAVADEDEHRLSVGGGAALVTLDAFGTSDTTEAYGGSLAASWGVRNWLDVGGDATYLVRPNAVLADAVVGGVGGDGFSLYVNLHDIQVAAAARFILEGVPSYRFRPVADLRVGVAVDVFARPELFDPDGGRALAGDTSTRVAPFVGADVGLTWRFAETLQVGLLATATVGADARSYGLQLELSRFSYDLL